MLVVTEGDKRLTVDVWYVNDYFSEKLRLIMFILLTNSAQMPAIVNASMQLHDEMFGDEGRTG